MNKNPWIKRKKEKDEGWEFPEPGFKIRHMDRGKPAIFGGKDSEKPTHPHNAHFCRWRTVSPDGIVLKDWRQDFGHTAEECGVGKPADEADGCFKSNPQEDGKDHSKDWQLASTTIWSGGAVQGGGYSVPEGGIDE